jgi:hypothetical protein
MFPISSSISSVSLDSLRHYHLASRRCRNRSLERFRDAIKFLLLFCTMACTVDFYLSWICKMHLQSRPAGLASHPAGKEVQTRLTFAYTSIPESTQSLYHHQLSSNSLLYHHRHRRRGRCHSVPPKASGPLSYLARVGTDRRSRFPSLRHWNHLAVNNAWKSSENHRPSRSMNFTSEELARRILQLCPTVLKLARAHPGVLMVPHRIMPASNFIDLMRKAIMIRRCASWQQYCVAVCDMAHCPDIG